MRHSYLRFPTSNSDVHYPLALIRVASCPTPNSLFRIAGCPTPNDLLRIAGCPTPNALLRVDGCPTKNTRLRITGYPTPNVLLRISVPYFVWILYGARLRIKTLLSGRCIRIKVVLIRM